MTKKIQFTLEYPINSSQRILYQMLSTPECLSEWFADDVKVKGKLFIFEWDGSEHTAKLAAKKELKLIRFEWLNDEKDKTFLEFRIDAHELTRDVALYITDFATKEDMEDARNLWDRHIVSLRRILGS
ncbi:MAG: SRPBCC domain-containing protein [Bacteroidia bacterium]|nr:SRPBCC domain-containing protein [Bacteroidia bacterium]